MSLNQVTQPSNKKWLIAKVHDLTVDGDIKVVRPSMRPGHVLSCVSPGVAEFMPLEVNILLPDNGYHLSSNGVQVNTVNFLFTEMSQYTNLNFDITASDTLTCLETGVYLVMKKITMNSPGSGSVICETLVNNTANSQSIIAIQGRTGGVGTGSSNIYLLSLTAGDTIKERISPQNGSYQNDQSRQTSYIQLIKI